ncbi:hypothetical protein CPB86DRAFT_693815, partial [Serendipita vermifera]
IMVPLEIWQLILQCAISAPEFLHPNYWADRFPSWVIKNREILDFKQYLEAEDTRLPLRRVCKTWDEYLRKYVHRFVHMCDVVHGNVPVQYLQYAIRI